MKLSASILVLLAAGTTQAGPVIWDNWFTPYSGLSSQLDANYPFDSQVADDFLFDIPGFYGVVSGVDFVGTFWNGSPLNPVAFNIYFYADDGTGKAPTTPVPGSALASYHFPSVLGTYIGNGPFGYPMYEYSVTLPSVFTATPKQKYWIAIQAEHFFPPQFGLVVSDRTTGEVNLSYAVQGFPLLGRPYWTDPGYGDVIFRLRDIPAPGTLVLLGLGALGPRRRR